jgi:hypothetical protein
MHAGNECTKWSNLMPIQTQEQRLQLLERTVRNFKVLCLISVVLGLALYIFSRHANANSPGTEVLHVRGIVIEDAAGRPRLLLGAPISSQGRKRRDEVTGLILLSNDGTDRLTIGTADYDQVNGALQHRIANGVGVMLNDTHGNERAGFGILDNGRVTLGLDRAHGEEGAFLTVNDEDGFAGLIVKDVGSCVVTTIGNSQQNGTRLLLRDQGCVDRVVLGIKDASTPQLEVRDRQEKLLFDAFSRPH